MREVRTEWHNEAAHSLIQRDSFTRCIYVIAVVPQVPLEMYAHSLVSASRRNRLKFLAYWAGERGEAVDINRKAVLIILNDVVDYS